MQNVGGSNNLFSQGSRNSRTELTSGGLHPPDVSIFRRRGSRCLDAPTRAVASATSQRFAGLEKLSNYDICVMCLNKRNFLKKHACLRTIELLCSLNIGGDTYSLVPPSKIIGRVRTPLPPQESTPMNLK